MHVDYHTHHERCGHAVGRLEEYVRMAVELGLDQIGLSDHMPLIHVDPADYLPDMAMTMDELPRYVEEALELKERFRGQIDVKVGLEADYIEGYEEEIERILSPYPWDYVIGSVHFLGRWDVTDYRQTAEWDHRDPDEVYRQYYRALGLAIDSGFYDIIGHFDVIKRFGYRPRGDVRPLEQEALERIAERGIALELNASGLRMPAKEMFPSPAILADCARLNLPVTLGSDAHRPDRVAEYLDQARTVLRQAGITRIAVFDKRQREMVDITKG